MKKQKNTYFNKIEEEYKLKQQEEKAKIKSEPNKWKRFWKWVLFWILFPWKWIFVNIRDWRTLVIFIIVFLLVSSEVWVPYLIGFICWNNETLRISMFSVGSAGFLFWNVVPCTPFLTICIGLTIAIKGIFNKIREVKKDGKENTNMEN